MKRIYIVTYDFKEAGHDYSGLYTELMQSQRWWHYLEHTWLISTDENAQRIYDRLSPHLDENINILIIEAGHDRQGWLPKDAWQWIREHLPKKAPTFGAVKRPR